ncbi:MAG: hypothetical protein AAF657_22955 [Acidobacteriota bacterium]
MERAGLTLTLMIWSGLVGPAVVAQPAEIKVEPSITRAASFEKPDGREIVVGHFGGQQDVCGVGTQGFVQSLEADGSETWLRCQRSGAASRCEQKGGSSLLADFTSLDPQQVVASRVFDLDVDELSGEIAITGEVLLACHLGADVEVSRAAFVGLLDADGNLLADAVIGDPPACSPTGEPICCRKLCQAPGGGPGGGVGGGQRCSGQGIGLGPQGVAVAGWCEIPGSTTGFDVFVASFTPSLGERWRYEKAYPHKDIALDAAIDDAGEVYVTGFTTGDGGRDVLVTHHAAASGNVRNAWVDGGTLDDEGHSISIDDDGNLAIDGYVEGIDTLKGEPIDGMGDGQRSFKAVLDRATLEPIQANVVLAPAAQTLPAGQTARAAQRPLPTPPPALESPLELVDCEVTAGWAGTGCLRVLSQGGFLNFTEGPVPGGSGKFGIEVELTYDPAPIAFNLTGLSLKIAAESCYTATFALKGLASEEYVQVASEEICPAQNPILSAEIRPETSAMLGLTTQAPAGPGLLAWKISLDFGTVSCSTCGTQAEHASFEVVDLDIEY